MPRKERRKGIVNDPRAPKRVKIKVNGKTLTIKQKAHADKGRWDTEMRESFLSLIREGFTNRDAAAACGAGTRYFKRRRDEDPEFEKAYQEAREDGNDVIRGEIKRRAVDGVKEAVYHDGKVVGYKTAYSDNLLMFLAKSRMEEFSDKQQVEHTHKFEGAAEQLVSKIAGILGVKPPALPPENPDLIDITPTEVEE